MFLSFSPQSFFPLFFFIQKTRWKKLFYEATLNMLRHPYSLAWKEAIAAIFSLRLLMPAVLLWFLRRLTQTKKLKLAIQRPSLSRQPIKLLHFCASLCSGIIIMKCKLKIRHKSVGSGVAKLAERSLPTPEISDTKANLRKILTVKSII